ncbi:hypothetical protein RFI_24929 [Reticulomyxa filosa]|uniref:Uncharacterized protein n=1 Tax=Reticulomyxa filosa TaxID=46433 RepID=X6MEM1_RETFI|nr:hypothetical protein RFI_24929 [Reticulomyxa filosa]|eukprot:ETO12448.1 hypothetical protein RFI_24929 [Reticulomyxa filosa]
MLAPTKDYEVFQKKAIEWWSRFANEEKQHYFLENQEIQFHTSKQLRSLILRWQKFKQKQTSLRQTCGIIQKKFDCRLFTKSFLLWKNTFEHAKVGICKIIFINYMQLWCQKVWKLFFFFLHNQTFFYLIDNSLEKKILKFDHATLREFFKLWKNCYKSKKLKKDLWVSKSLFLFFSCSDIYTLFKIIL